MIEILSKHYDVTDDKEAVDYEKLTEMIKKEFEEVKKEGFILFHQVVIIFEKDYLKHKAYCKFHIEK